MSLPITMYGATDCEDTAHVFARLTALGIPFRYVNIDHDPEAERFVIFINNGFRSTPTLVIGEGKWKTVVTEPTDEHIEELVHRVLAHPQQ